MPGGAQGTLWYYNKALFEAAGLDPETPPATWAEFEEACTKLAEAGTTPLGMSGIDGNLLWWGWLSFSPQFFTTAEEVLKVRSGEIKLNDERFLQSLQPIASTYDKGWWNEDYASKKFADIEAAFGAGQMGIVPGLDHLGDELEGVRRHARRRQLWRVPVAAGRRRSAAGPVLQPRPAVRDQQGCRGRRHGTLVDLGDRVEGRPGDDARAVGAVPEPHRRRRHDAGQQPGRDRDQGHRRKVGGVPVAQNQFNSAALGAATQNITSAAVSGDLQGFLDNLESLQSS